MVEENEFTFYPGNVVGAINILCDEDHSDLDFTGKSALIQRMVEDCDRDMFLQHLDHAGIIPECFSHDSTEEKLYAKYCDALVAKGLSEIGIESQAIAERGDAADVIGEGDGYTIVGDAKAFRLSRTAKNAKDFKVESLNKWRKGANYACLVGPLYQYPSTRSQIYAQAIRFNVTILSYVHLAFLVRNSESVIERGRLQELWTVPGNLEENQRAGNYWTAIDRKIIEITGTDGAVWDEFVRTRLAMLPEQAEEQIEYLDEEKERISNMLHEQAVRELIKALKIDAKIDIIRRYTRG